MNSLLMIVACIGMSIVAEVGVAFWWLRKEFHSLINEAVVPWMVTILKAIQGKQ